jgi:DNA polymerase elongation subunit (family B)
MGVLPSLVSDWKRLRLEGKAEASRLKAAASSETDPIKKTQYQQDAKRAVLLDACAKAFLNTLYGLLGAQSFMLYDRRLAQSVTAYARQSIMITRDIIVNELGGKLIASDTDSVSYQLNNAICTPDQIN